MKLHIDSDTGLDDAMALVHGFLDPRFDIVSITTVFGNSSVEHCTQHALEIVDYMGSDVPVVAGAPEPLISGCGPAPHVHGEFGRGGLGPATPREQTPGLGAVFILDQVRKHGKDLAIVAMGRLTNLALAFRLDPLTMRQVGHIYWMGGVFSAPGNTSPVAEANLDGDPEAGKIIVQSGLPLTILPLDVTMGTRVTAEDVHAMAAVEHPGVQHLSRVLPYYLDFYESILGIPEAAAHCGLLLAIAADESLILEAHHLPVDVELAGALTRGMSVIDRRALRSISPEHAADGVRVIFHADADRYHREFMDSILNADATRR